MLLARSSHIRQLSTVSPKFGRNRIKKWQIAQGYIMVRNPRIYFSTKKVVYPLSNQGLQYHKAVLTGAGKAGPASWRSQ